MHGRLPYRPACGYEIMGKRAVSAGIAVIVRMAGPGNCGLLKNGAAGVLGRPDDRRGHLGLVAGKLQGGAGEFGGDLVP